MPGRNDAPASPESHRRQRKHAHTTRLACHATQRWTCRPTAFASPTHIYPPAPTPPPRRAAAMRYDDDMMAYADIDDYGNDGPGILYPLSVFFALGIWLVFQRYQSMRNRAVPFRIRPPEVRLRCAVAPLCGVADAPGSKLGRTSRR